MTIKKADFRICYTDGMGNKSYLVRNDGKINYYSSSEIPLALSNMVGSHAAELRFAVSDAITGEKALTAVKDALRAYHPGAADIHTKVRLLL